MTTPIDVLVQAHDGSTTPRRIDVTRAFNMGSATRDAAEAELHQREMADVGVHIAFDVPAPRIYPLAPQMLTTAEEVLVHGTRTSGEVEIVIVVDGDEVLVGVGSDHTDRELEQTSIPWSKQVCPNVLAPTMWRWEDVSEGWDECELRSDVDGRAYQRVATGVFLSPPDVLQVLKERMSHLPPTYVVFCGTYVSVDGRLGYGARWEFALHDPSTDRTIAHGYGVVPLLDEVRDDFRVPLRTGS